MMIFHALALAAIYIPFFVSGTYWVAPLMGIFALLVGTGILLVWKKLVESNTLDEITKHYDSLTQIKKYDPKYRLAFSVPNVLLALFYGMYFYAPCIIFLNVSMDIITETLNTLNKDTNTSE